MDKGFNKEFLYHLKILFMNICRAKEVPKQTDESVFKVCSAV